MKSLSYKCACMECDGIVQVPARPPGSDLMLWMNAVTATIAMDHAARNPRCRSTVMEYIKIPLDDANAEIGSVPTKN